MLVMKFGGTSVASGERILNVAAIIAESRDKQPIIVVSAMSQITNLLVELAADAPDRQQHATITAGIERIRQEHQQAINDLALEPSAETTLLATLDGQMHRLESIFENTASLEELTPRGKDLLISYGERLVVNLVAAALQKQGLTALVIEADDLIITDDNFGNAQPQLSVSRATMKPKLQKLVNKGIIPVITGFMGGTTDGVTTVLGRGGSDYSATIIGHCTGAEAVWIWTDVNGVMTADPRIIRTARTIDELSYDEAAELSYFGAKVLHPRTMVPAALSQTPIQIKNTLQPGLRGTRITHLAQPHPDGAKAMTVLSNLSLITVQGKGMQGVLGMAGRVFTTLAEHAINVLFISQASSENNISLVIAGQDGVQAVQALREAFQPEMKAKNVESVQQESDVAMIAVVGEGMRSHTGIAGRIFSALGSADINVIAIAQGSSERNISFVVKKAQSTAALQAVHDELHLENSRTKRQKVAA